MENIQNLLARLTSAKEYRGRSCSRDPSQYYNPDIPRETIKYPARPFKIPSLRPSKV